MKPNGDNGTYGCEAGLATVWYELGYDPDSGIGVQTARKGDATLCEVFDGITLTPDNYWYNWSDNCCEDEACSIIINNWFTSPEVIDATGGKADRIELRAYAEAVGPFTDSNPFVDPQVLYVDEIRIMFTAPGFKTVCRYTYDNPGEVAFHSWPQP